MTTLGAALRAWAPARASSAAAPLAVAAAAVALGALAGASPTLLLLCAVIAGAAALAVVRPEALAPVACFLLVLNAPSVAVDSQGLPGVVLLAPLALLLVPVAYHAYRGAPSVRSPVLLPLVLLILAMALSAAVSPAGATAWAAVLKTIVESIAIVVLLLHAVRSTAALRACIWAAVAAAGALGALSVVQWSTGDFDRAFGGFAQVPLTYLAGFDEEVRASGPVGDPNYYAQFMLAVLCVAAVALLLGRRNLVPTVAAVVLCGLTLAGVVLTLSRGAALGALVGVLAATALGLLRLRYMLVLAAAVAVALALVPSYGARLASLDDLASTASSEDQSVRSRATEMQAAWLAFQDNPVLGIGPAAFPSEYQRYAIRIGGDIHGRQRFGSDRGEAPEREAHNLVLGLAADVGLIGLGLFAAVIGAAIAGLLGVRRRVRHVDPELWRIASGLLVALVAYLAAGLFLSLAFERYLWLLVGLAAVTAALARRPGAEPGPVRRPAQAAPQAAAPTPIAAAAPVSDGPAAAARAPRLAPARPGADALAWARRRLADEPERARAMLRRFAGELMSAEADDRCGAPLGRQSSLRVDRRNGYRSWRWRTGLGTIHLRVPRLRASAYTPEWIAAADAPAESVLTAAAAEALVCGTTAESVRRVADRLGVVGVSESRAGQIAAALEADLEEERARPIERPYRVLRLELVQVAEPPGRRMAAVGLDEGGAPRLLACEPAPADGPADWAGFLEALARRGLEGVRIVTADPHPTLPEAVETVLGASWRPPSEGAAPS
jgi:O-antigen ligase